MTFCEVVLGMVLFLLGDGIIFGDIVGAISVAGASVDIFRGTGLEIFTKTKQLCLRMIAWNYFCQLLLKPTSSIDSPVSIIICLIIGSSHIDTVGETHQKTENCSTMHNSGHYLIPVQMYISPSLVIFCCVVVILLFGGGSFPSHSQLWPTVTGGSFHQREAFYRTMTSE